MAKHIGIKPGVLYPQPDYSLSVDREGKWTAKQVYLCHRTSVTALMPKRNSAHPEIAFITLDSATAEVMDGDLAEITCNYVGVEPTPPEPGDEDNPGASPSYSLGLSVSEEPLMSHYRYKDITAKEKEYLQLIISGKDKDDQGNVLRSKVTSNRGKEALTKIERGQTSYYSPRVIWKASWVSATALSGAQLNAIGKISTPTGPCPALNNRDWLLNGATQTIEGAAYRIEIEWLCSDNGKWDPDIYS